jgi:hypothetical protein
MTRVETKGGDTDGGTGGDDGGGDVTGDNGFNNSGDGQINLGYQGNPGFNSGDANFAVQTMQAEMFG